MIDTKELRRLAQAALAVPDGLSAEWMDRLGQFQDAADASVVSELLDRLEAAESARRDDYQNWMTALDRNAELLAKLEAAERERDDVARQLVQSEQGKRKISEECDTYKAAYNEWIAKTEWMQDELTCGKLPAKHLGMHRADGIKAEIDALRAKVGAMEKQEPFDADSDVFRSVFEAALKAGNWPATRQGDGYRSPSTQIAWRIAFSTVNRLKLYLAPGAQSAPSVPEGFALVNAAHFLAVLDREDWRTAKNRAELRAMLAAPEAKP